MFTQALIPVVNSVEFAWVRNYGLSYSFGFGRVHSGSPRIHRFHSGSRRFSLAGSPAARTTGCTEVVTVEGGEKEGTRVRGQRSATLPTNEAARSSWKGEGGGQGSRSLTTPMLVPVVVGFILVRVGSLRRAYGW